MYCYPIYTIDTWSMLTINNPTIMFMCCPCFHHVSTSLLQFNDLRIDQREKPCIWVNTRELDREFCTGSFTLYTKT